MEEGCYLLVELFESLEPWLPGLIKVLVPMVEVGVDVVLGGVEGSPEAMIGEIDAVLVVTREEGGEVALDFFGGEWVRHDGVLPFCWGSLWLFAR